jgi:glycosyltransferase involved in cell wall biosynthesis
MATMMKKADMVLSVSYELAKNGPVSMKVLPNGVENSAIDSTSENTPCTIKANRQPVVGFIGSFEYFIDFKTILGAARLCPEVLFLLVGTGRDFEYVRNMVVNLGLSNVKLTGGVPHDEVFAYIRVMDICMNIFKPLQVSHRACPIKLFEYLSQKKPVISTRLSELAHIDDGWLYYADTASELAATIQEILNGYDAALKKAEKAYNMVRGKYTWEKIAQSFLDYVNDIQS